ncbi:hypothetical protein [Actinomadura rudentiformis]|uniref:Uncharacterized protein n=1 Tax=Actinomadura rudentiformis TaxID=359158 RepID=A0A6H9YYE0_9ACTN|nr:hypothetical protein [Actinomadura rudentiformis]KAB2350169.1 hypothetical protein F8566_10265 [Actinomadura rudentiformis]
MRRIARLLAITVTALATTALTGAPGLAEANADVEIQVQGQNVGIYDLTISTDAPGPDVSAQVSVG